MLIELNAPNCTHDIIRTSFISYKEFLKRHKTREIDKYIIIKSRTDTVIMTSEV